MVDYKELLKVLEVQSKINRRRTREDINNQAYFSGYNEGFDVGYDRCINDVAFFLHNSGI